MAISSQQDLADKFRESSMDFIEVEIRTGANFADIALNSSDEDRRKRDRVNARKAYDSALSFLQKHDGPATEAEKLHVHEGLRALKAQLSELEEKFQDGE